MLDQEHESSFANEVSKRLSAFVLTVPKNVKDDLNDKEYLLLDAYKGLLYAYVYSNGDMNDVELVTQVKLYRSILNSTISNDSERTLKNVLYVKYKHMNIQESDIMFYLHFKLLKHLEKLKVDNKIDRLKELLDSLDTNKYSYNYLRELMTYKGWGYLLYSDSELHNRYKWDRDIEVGDIKSAIDSINNNLYK